MHRPRFPAGPLLLLFLIAPIGAQAAEFMAPAEPGAIATAISNAAPGDVIKPEPGRHNGCITIDRSITIDGGGSAILTGCGEGSVVTVAAPDVTLKGLTIQGSGSSAEDRDSGIKLLKSADRARVVDNRIIGNLIGVDVHGTRNAFVGNNVIEGRRDYRMNSRGNAVYVWNAPGSRVEYNDIRWGRDGIFVNTSKDNKFIGNRFRDLRFAIHYMYANNSEVRDNVSIGNHLGYAVMFSKRVLLQGNVSRDDRDYGIMLNYTNDSLIVGNRISNTEDRCVFIYNAHKNRLENNLFERCAIGIHFTAGSERNTIVENAFIGNRTQVKYVGSRWVDWSDGGRGNYWSDFTAYDLNGDGVAETAYRPNDAIDRVLWTQPSAKLLLGSPAVQLIRWVQSVFPALLPGGVVDRHPLMRPNKLSTVVEGVSQ